MHNTIPEDMWRGRRARRGERGEVKRERKRERERERERDDTVWVWLAPHSHIHGLGCRWVSANVIKIPRILLREVQKSLLHTYIVIIPACLLVS